MPNNEGFTLIELLVVITIIAVLSVIGMVAYSGFLKNSRDAKRQSDLRIIQSALEDYHSDQIYYPASIQQGTSLTSPNGRIYLNQIPKDLKSDQSYSYTPSPLGCSGTGTSPTCTSYCLYAKFEGSNVPPSDQGCSASGYNFGITRP